MNEEALKDAYGIFQSEGYNGSIQDFQSLLKTNNDAFLDAFSAFSQEGYNGSSQDFAELMGISEVKKKDASQLESSMDQASTASTQEMDSLDSAKSKSKSDQINEDFGATETVDIQSSGEMGKPSVDTETALEGEELIKEKAKKSSLNLTLNNFGNTWQSIGNNLIVGLNELSQIANPTVAALRTYAEFTDNEIVKRAIAEADEMLDPLSITETFSKLEDENSKQILENTIARKWDSNKTFKENVSIANESIPETFEREGVLGGMSEIGVKLFESSPYMITAAATGGVGGIGVTAGTFATAKYGETIGEEIMDDGDISMKDQARAITKGIVEGSANVIMDGLGKMLTKAKIFGDVSDLGGISSVGRELLGDVTAAQAKQALKGGIKEGFKSISAGATRSALGEGIEEVFQEVGGYAVDAAFGEAIWDWDLAQRIGTDAFILGSAGGGAFGGAASAIKYSRAKALLDPEVSGLTEEQNMQSTKDNPAKASYIKNEKKRKLGEYQIPDDISDEDLSEMNSLYYQIKHMKSGENTIQNQTVAKAYRQKIEEKEARLQELLSKYEVNEEGDSNATRETPESGAMGDQAESTTQAIDGEVQVGDAKSEGELSIDREPITDPDSGEQIVDTEVIDENKLELEPETTKKKIERKLVDASVALKDFQKQIESLGTKIFGTKADAYNALDLEKNMAQARVTGIANKMASFSEDVQNSSVTLEQFDQYKKAMHAPERNSAIRENISAEMQQITSQIDELFDRVSELDAIEEDGELTSKQQKERKEKLKQISKLEDKLDEQGVSYLMNGSGMSDQKAKEILDSFTPEQINELEALSKTFQRDFLDPLIQQSIESGIINEDKAAKIQRFEHYVPLKVEEYESLKGGERSGGTQKKRKGITTPFKRLKKGADNAKRRTNVYVASVNELVNLQGKVARNNLYNSFSDLVGKAEELGKNVGVKIVSAVPYERKSPDGTTVIEMGAPKGFTKSDDTIEFYKDGKLKYMNIADARLRNALTQENMYGKGIYDNATLQAFNSYFRLVNTALSPEFMITNLLRDFQSAAISMNVELEDASMKTFTAKTAKYLKELAKRTTGKAADNDAQRMIDRYEQSGGKMSWSTLNSSSRISDMAKAANELEIDENGKIKKGNLKKLIELGTSLSDITEHVTRLAAFEMAYEQLSAKGDPNAERKAAILAKEVTVNFNRRGEWGNLINALYVFANAGIQGTNRIVHALGKSKKVRALAGGLVAMGFAEGLLNDMYGDDEDEYEQMKEYEKQRYLNFKIPNGKAVKLTLPYGWSSFKYMGSKMYETMKNVNNEGGLTAKDLDNMKLVMGDIVSNINPFGGGTAGQFVSPTITDPLIQSIEKKDFMGNDLEKKEWGMSRVVKSWGGKESTPEIYKTIAKSINSLAGGSANTPALDMSPEIYRLWIETAGGGVGRTAVRGYITARNMIKGEDVEMKDTPIVRQFLKDKDPEDWNTIYKFIDKQKTREFSDYEMAKFEKSVVDVWKNSQDLTDGEKSELADRLNGVHKALAQDQQILKLAKMLDITFDDAKILYRRGERAD